MRKFISSDIADHAANELNFSLQVCLKACFSDDPRRVSEIGARLDDLEMQKREAFECIRELNARRMKTKVEREARDVQALRLLLALEDLTMMMRARYERACRELRKEARHEHE